MKSRAAMNVIASLRSRSLAIDPPMKRTAGPSLTRGPFQVYCRSGHRAGHEDTHVLGNDTHVIRHLAFYAVRLDPLHPEVLHPDPVAVAGQVSVPGEAVASSRRHQAGSARRET